MKEKKTEVLAIIPARSGSKRVLNKNIKIFCGQPLMAFTIKQALASPIINRVIVDTDSETIAKIGKKHGAQVPWLRPKELATDSSNIILSILNILKELKEKEDYVPTHVMLLQPTSPLRLVDDIMECWNKMKSANTTSVVTVCPTQPKFYRLNQKGDLLEDSKQANAEGYVLNGLLYIVKTDNFIREKAIITKKTKAVVSPRWRSIDIDTPEDWALAEIVYKNRKLLSQRLKLIKGRNNQ